MAFEWKDLIPVKNGAQIAKMGCHLAADGCSFIPPPFHLIGTVFEGGAYIAGRCDPLSSKEAEAKEAAIRGAVSLIPFSGVAKIASKPLMLTVKYGVGLGVKEGVSTVVNIRENDKNGKSEEITNSKAIEAIKGMFKESDFDSLSQEEKTAALKAYFADKSASNQHIVDDETHERITEVAFLERNGLAPKPIFGERIREQAQETYLKVTGKTAEDLTQDDRKEISKIYKQVREQLEGKGVKVIRMSSEQKSAAADIQAMMNSTKAESSLPIQQLNKVNAISASIG